MTFLDKLNLNPQERRLVVGILVVLFIILNVLLVWPHFGDWARVRRSLNEAHFDLAAYQRKIAQVPGPNGFEANLKKLEGESSISLPEEQDVQLLRAVQNQVALSKVTVTSYGQISTQSSGKTNEFFEEQSIPITVNTGEKELVDFLLNIGAGSSMIRVRDLDLKPADQNRYRLQGRITLSANYQKKPAARPVAPARGTAGQPGPAPARKT